MYLSRSLYLSFKTARASSAQTQKSFRGKSVTFLPKNPSSLSPSLSLSISLRNLDPDVWRDNSKEARWRAISISLHGGRAISISLHRTKISLTLTRSDRSSDLSSHGVERISMLTSPLSKGCRHSSSTTDTAEERHDRHDLLASSTRSGSMPGSPHHSSAFFPATAATKFEKSAIGKAVKAQMVATAKQSHASNKGEPVLKWQMG